MIRAIKTKFFTGISHEFRTPLTLLMGPLENLLHKLQGKEDPDWSLYKMMQRNTLRLKTLIDQLLELSKMDTGNIRLEISQGDLTGFLTSLVQSFHSLAESNGIDYTYTLKKSTGKLYFDEDKLEKILANLISNAIKFTPPGGQIDIKIDYLYGESNKPQFLVMEVKDAGQGIPEDQIEHIFDRFL